MEGEDMDILVDGFNGGDRTKSVTCTEDLSNRVSTIRKPVSTGLIKWQYLESIKLPAILSLVSEPTAGFMEYSIRFHPSGRLQ